MHVETVFDRHNIMYVFRVSSPGKIMNIWSDKIPRNFFSMNNSWIKRGIAMTNFFRSLQVTRCSNRIVFVNIYCNIKIAPNPIKLSAKIGVCMPAFSIIFTKLRIPLSHRKSHPVFIVFSSTPNNGRNLNKKRHVQSSFFPRKQRRV